MPMLLTLAFLTFVIGLGFPPMLIVSAFLFYKLVKRHRANVAKINGIRQAKRDRARDREHNKAVRFFQ